MVTKSLNILAEKGIKAMILRLLVVSLVFIFSATVNASGHLGMYRIMLPCFATSYWMEVARQNKFKSVDSRIDDDGDIWVIWQFENDGWRSTLTIRNGTVTCPIGGKGRVLSPGAPNGKI